MIWGSCNHAISVISFGSLTLLDFDISPKWTKAMFLHGSWKQHLEDNWPLDLLWLRSSLDHSHILSTLHLLICHQSDSLTERNRVYRVCILNLGIFSIIYISVKTTSKNDITETCQFKWQCRTFMLVCLSLMFGLSVKMRSFKPKSSGLLPGVLRSENFDTSGNLGKFIPFKQLERVCFMKTSFKCYQNWKHKFQTPRSSIYSW